MPKSDFFFFAIPKPLSDVTVLDLPNDTSPKSVVKLGDTLWFSGDGSVIEYDTKANKLMSYSNPKKANCDGNMVYIAPYLYAVCRIDNIDDAFETTRQLSDPLFEGHQAILQIDPQTHTLIHTFSKADGLLNGFNYRIYADGDMIWVATFDGFGRINTKTNHVDFYTTNSIFPTSHKSGNNGVLVDKDYVWIWTGSNSESQGGVAVFNKKSLTWQTFEPKDLKDSDQNSIDLEYSDHGTSIKLIPNGIQLAFRDGKKKQPGNTYDTDVLVEKQYHYDTKQWTKLPEEHAATGPVSESTTKYLEQAYPRTDTFEKIMQEGLTQIKLLENNTMYNINGRKNVLLSNMIGTTRYLLTNASVDVIDDTYPFRQLLIKLGEPLSTTFTQSIPTDKVPKDVSLLIDPSSLISIIIEAGCEGMGCGTNQKIWLVDLKAKKILKFYTQKTDTMPKAELLRDLHMTKDGDNLHIQDKDGKEVFSVNSKSMALTVPPANIQPTLDPRQHSGEGY